MMHASLALPLRASACRVATGLFLDDNDDDDSQCQHPTLLLQASAHRIAMGPLLDNNLGHQHHITQHHHPACEPLLVEGDGGADDDEL